MDLFLNGRGDLELSRSFHGTSLPEETFQQKRSPKPCEVVTSNMPLKLDCEACNS